MPTTDAAASAGVEHVSIPSGEQHLVLTSSMSSLVDSLPDEAFDNLLLISVGQHPDKIERAIRRRGHDPASVGVVPVNGSSFVYDGPMWTADRINPTDLTGISIAFSQALGYVKPGRGWVCLDSISTLLMYAGDRRLRRLVASLADRTRDQNARGAYALVRDSVSDDTYADFRALFDGEADARSPQG